MQWNPRPTTIARVMARTEYLIDHFTNCIEHFNQISDTLFDGPSFYFHYKCIREFPSLENKICVENRTAFLELVYATLASWGMHRMGDTKTRLVNFNDFKISIYTDLPNDQVELFEFINGYNICDLPITINNNVPPVFDMNHDNAIIVNHIKDLVSKLRVSQSDSHLVANSKALHHIFPNLVVPIDREYTLRFFGINGNRLNTNNYETGTEDVFEFLYPSIIKIAIDKETEIEQLVENNQNNLNSWHTSFTKVIDNAIIGAVKQGDYLDVN